MFAEKSSTAIRQHQFSLVFNRYFVPIFLILVCPPTVMLIWHVNVNHGGDFVALVQEIQEQGFWNILHKVWFRRFWGTWMSWKIVGIFSVIQILFMKFLPGASYCGPMTEKSNIPVYKSNGVLSYLLSIGLFLICSLWFQWFSPGIVYFYFGDILASLNIFALLFCVLLYLKGLFFPSSSDCGRTESVIFDYYWGTELYPRFLGIDVKMFTNNRFGMIGWALIVISFTFAKQEIYGGVDFSIIVSASLICLYLYKFFLWEEGYMHSMDIITDRAGFYICWGCLVWVPALYTSPVMFMVNQSTSISLSFALAIFLLGSLAIFTNYWADWQRQITRKTQGRKKIFGKAPVIIAAKYIDKQGKERDSLLLASGFWGWSRHFHYLPEIAAAFIWSATYGFQRFMPFFYVIFLSILLFHRSRRDDIKCQCKYGKYWEEYCRLVPSKVIPKIY